MRTHAWVLLLLGLTFPALSFAQTPGAEERSESAEAKREAAAAKREAADAKRETAEAKRETADAKREAAEAKREAADAKREGAEAKREGAEAKREAADEKREEAREKREEALELAAEAREKRKDAVHRISEQRRKRIQEVIESRKDLVAARQKAREAAKSEWKTRIAEAKDEVNKAALTAELQRHARTTARLARARELAQTSGDQELINRVDELIAKEDGRHNRWMGHHMKGGTP